MQVSDMSLKRDFETLINTKISQPINTFVSLVSGVL